MANPEEYKDKDLFELFEQMKNDIVEKALAEVSERLCLDYDSVHYSASRYNKLISDSIPAFEGIKAGFDAQTYNAKTGQRLLPLQYIKLVRRELTQVFDEYVMPFKNMD